MDTLELVADSISTKFDLHVVLDAEDIENHEDLKNNLAVGYTLELENVRLCVEAVIRLNERVFIGANTV